MTTSLDPSVRRVPANGSVWKPLRRRAFSLVEMLVAMAVTLLLVLILVQIFSGASNTWRRSEQKVDAYREARGALQLMARDLAETIPAAYAQPWGGSVTAVNPPMPTLVLQHYSDFSGTGANPGGPVNEEVYCLTNIRNQGTSSLCAVGYYCQWMPGNVPVSSDGVDRVPRAYALMRQSLDSNGTNARLQAAVRAAGGNPLVNPLSFLDIYSRTGTPATSIAQVAAYIWDLRFRIGTDLSETAYPDGNTPPPPDVIPQASPSPAPIQHKYGGDVNSWPYPPTLPAYVEIRFRALSDLAARRLEGPNSGVDQTTWNDSGTGFTPTSVYSQTIQPNYQQFILRVPLRNTPQS